MLRIDLLLPLCYTTFRGGDDMFEEMIFIAKNKLATIDEIIEGLPAPQVTVLLSNNNNVYVAVNDIDGIICEKIKHDKNTKITQMLTMWKDGSIDISSYAFRKTLVKMDRDNNNTDVLLQDKNNYLIKKLADTII